MDITQDIPASILDNKAEFTGPFYERYKLAHAPTPVELLPGVSKNYQFPTFYGDVTCAQAIFLCSYTKADRLVKAALNDKVQPVKMPKGRAILAFSCYEYKKVLGVRPYNEIAVAIPIMVNAGWNPPVLPMVLPFKKFGYYIASMPVTSYENTLRGHKIWGLPKVTQRINIEKTGGDSVTTAFEENGDRYFRLNVPTEGGSPTAFDVNSYLYSKLDGRFIRSRTSFKATFNVIKHMDLLFKKGKKPERTYLEIGSGPSGKFLSALEPEEHPFQLRYAEGMSSCFDRAESDPPAWARL